MVCSPRPDTVAPVGNVASPFSSSLDNISTPFTSPTLAPPAGTPLTVTPPVIAPTSNISASASSTVSSTSHDTPVSSPPARTQLVSIPSSEAPHKSATPSPPPPPPPSPSSSPPVQTTKASPSPPPPPSSSAPPPPSPPPPPPPKTTSAQPQPAPTSNNAVAAPSDDGSSGGTSASDIAAYLSGHNDVRAQHGAAPLTWNDNLAAKAQQWANGCVFQHSGGSLGPFGENLAAGTASDYGIAAAIKSWTDEVCEL